VAGLRGGVAPPPYKTRWDRATYRLGLPARSRTPAGGGIEERMNRETSVYLDLVRFVAAVFVFLTHAGRQQSSGGLF